VGTSLVVGPIHQMFDVAAGSDAATAILTASETPYDDVCDFKLASPVEQTLPEVSRLVSDG
jgi:NAD-dependent SIR2 family protein deacetylase